MRKICMEGWGLDFLTLLFLCQVVIKLLFFLESHPGLPTSNSLILVANIEQLSEISGSTEFLLFFSINFNDDKKHVPDSVCFSRDASIAYIQCILDNHRRIVDTVHNQLII